MNAIDPLPPSADAADAPAAPARRSWLDRLGDVRFIGVWAQSVRHYIEHQSATQAGSIAFSTVLAMFPLLILVSSIAGFVGRPGAAAELAVRVLGYAPPLVKQALQPVVGEVLGRRSEALLAVGIFGTVWAASSGMQAVRTGLNRAYGVTRGLAFWRARIKVTLFTVLVGLGTIASFSSVVVMPYVWHLVSQTAANPQQAVWLNDSVRYGSAFVVLSCLYALVYAWLPDIPLRVVSVWPGAVLGAALWLGAASLLSHVLRAASKLLLVYGSFAGVVATLVFLYASAVTLLFGAEMNGVLRLRAAARGGDRQGG